MAVEETPASSLPLQAYADENGDSGFSTGNAAPANSESAGAVHVEASAPPPEPATTRRPPSNCARLPQSRRPRVVPLAGKRKELHKGYENLNSRVQQSHDVRLKELDLQERRLALDECQMAINERRVALCERRMSMEENRLDLEIQKFHDTPSHVLVRERQLQQFSVEHTLVLALKDIVKDICK